MTKPKQGCAGDIGLCDDTNRKILDIEGSAVEGHTMEATGGALRQLQAALFANPDVKGTPFVGS